MLRVVVAQLCQSVGFETCQVGAIDILVDILERFLLKIGEVSSNYSEQCLQNEVHINDVLQCFKQQNFPLSELCDYFQQMEDVQFPCSVPLFPKKTTSNLQFPKEPHENPDLEAHVPSQKCAAVPFENTYAPPVDLNSSQASSNNGDQVVAGHRRLAEDSDDGSVVETDDTRPEDIIMQGTAASSCDTGAALDDSMSEVNNEQSASADGDPLWITQHIAKQQETKGRGPTTSKSAENFPSVDANSWDSPKRHPRGKFYNAKDGTSSMSKYAKLDQRRMMMQKNSHNVTSRIEEVDRLLQDPIMESVPIKSEYRPASYDYPQITLRLAPPEGCSPPVARQKTYEKTKVDNVIDSVINKASKDAKEAELMKFCHLINNSSSSDDEGQPRQSKQSAGSSSSGGVGGGATSNTADPYSNYSQIKPPLTPSPALSPNSIMMDDEDDDEYTMKNNDFNRSDLDVREPLADSRIQADHHDDHDEDFADDHDDIGQDDIGFDNLSEEEEELPVPKSPTPPPPTPPSPTPSPPPPVYRSPTPEPVAIECFEKVKKKTKHKSSSRKRKHAEDSGVASSSGGGKSIEKFVLKKSRTNTGEARITSSSSSYKEASLPVPKLSAALDVMVPSVSGKRKEKKEKKKKKDKDRESRRKSHHRSSNSNSMAASPPPPEQPAPRMKFKLKIRSSEAVVTSTPVTATTTTSHREIKEPKIQPYVYNPDPNLPKPRLVMGCMFRKHTSKKETKASKKTESSSKAAKKSAAAEIKAQKAAETKVKVTSKTIHLPPPPSLGIIFDKHGNKIWICPGCKRADDGSPMIGCDDCDAWYHWPCVNIAMEPPEDEKWFCPNCRVIHSKSKKKSSKRKKQR